MFNETDEVINFFEKGTFPYKGNVFKTKEESEEESEEELEEESEEELEKTRDDYKIFIEYIENESTMICLKIILILRYLVLWQHNYMRQKIKTKTKS